MRVLVTGGAGHVGTYLTRRLVELGHDVTVLDDLTRGRWSRVESLGVECVEANVLDRAAVQAAVDGTDLVYHLAAAVGVDTNVRRPLDALRTNLNGEEIVLEACHAAGAKAVLASSSEVYGKLDKPAFAEDDDMVLGPTRVARWGYALAKALGEQFAYAYGADGLRFSVVRFFNTFGPYQTYSASGIVGRAVAGEPITVHGDGSHVRSFCFVRDSAEGCLRAGLRPEAEGEVINIGSTRPLTVLEYVELVRRVTDSSSAIEFVPYEEVFGTDFEDPPFRCPDVQKAKELLDWTAETDLESAVAETADWWRSTGGDA